MIGETGEPWLAGVAEDLRSAVTELEALARVQRPAAEALAQSSRELAQAAQVLGREEQPRAWAAAKGRWAEELTAAAVAEGVERALRRQEAGAWLTGPGGLPGRGGGGVSGTGYGRMGATLTGRGERAQTYGAIGGAIGYALGGPVGAFLLGAIGGLFGGRRDRGREREARAWLNTPEEFEIQAYLYNLTRAGWQTAVPRIPWQAEGARTRAGHAAQAMTVQVQMAAGAIQINGQGEEAGERAARAFAGYLGRALLLNSVVAPAAGWMGDL